MSWHNFESVRVNARRHPDSTADSDRFRIPMLLVYALKVLLYKDSRLSIRALPYRLRR